MIRPALVMYVMIGMAWPVLGLSEDAAVADFLTPPDSIGTAYDTNPPPLASLASLASLKGVLGSKPSQADLDLYVRSWPIRLTPMTATCRVRPLSRVKLGIGWSRGVARDAEQ